MINWKKTKKTVLYQNKRKL